MLYIYINKQFIINKMLRAGNFNLNNIKDMSMTDAKRYIDQYFYILTNGSHALYNYDKKEYEIYDKHIIKSTYFDRMPSELNKYYFKEKTDLKTITYDINRNELYDNYLNLCPKIMHEYKPYSEFDDNIKASVNLMLSHLKNCICSSHEDQYQFLLKWFANMVRGNHNISCLYLKGPQGVGKSIIIDFLRDNVIGNKLATQCGSRPFKTNFNSELSGKLMVMIEELENMSVSEWMGVSCVLKRQITSNVLSIERKGQDVREEKNLNNYIILSNNDAIQDDDGRRYFIVDLSTKYIKNEEYFKRLLDIRTDEVGHAFYCYLCEIDLTGYNAQSYPDTQNKMDSFAKRLDIVAKFLKEEYVLHRKGIDKILVGDMYNKFCIYCSKLNIKPKNKIDFNKSLKDLGIEYKKSNGNNYYVLSLDELNNISQKFKWVHELDEYYNDNNVFDDNKKASLDNDVKLDDEVKIDYEALYKQQLVKIKELETQIKEMKKKQVTLPYFDFEKVDKLIDEVNTLKPIKPVKGFNNMIQKIDEPIDEDYIDDFNMLKKLRDN